MLPATITFLSALSLSRRICMSMSADVLCAYAGDASKPTPQTIAHSSFFISVSSRRIVRSFGSFACKRSVDGRCVQVGVGHIGNPAPVRLQQRATVGDLIDGEQR